jgi:thermitase
MVSGWKSFVDRVTGWGSVAGDEEDGQKVGSNMWTYRRLIRAATTLSCATALAVASMPCARAQTPSYPNDPLFPKQWYVHNTGQVGGTPGADIHALEAWGITRCSPDEIIADVDTGAYAQHEDLASKILPGISFSPGQDYTQDGINHGTQVVSVAAAATDNGVGMAGVCPLGKILPVKVSNNGGGFIEGAVPQGIRWAVDHGARVINMSFGGDADTDTQDALTYAYDHNVVAVAAAGTSSLGVYPADYPHVIAVAGSDNKDQPTAGTDVTNPDLVLAPDKEIIDASNNGSYTVFCTCISIASPQVAGIAALLFSLRPDLTVDQVIDLIDHGADFIPGQTAYAPQIGWGRVNAYKSLLRAQKLPPFTLSVSPRSRSVASGTKETVTMKTLPDAKVTVKISLPGSRKVNLVATVGASGVYRHGLKVGATTGTAMVSVTAVHGWATLKKSTKFSIH